MTRPLVVLANGIDIQNVGIRCLVTLFRYVTYRAKSWRNPKLAKGWGGAP